MKRDISNCIISKPFALYDDRDYDLIEKNRYHLAAYLKKGRLDQMYQTIYMLNCLLDYDILISRINQLLELDEVLRIKGFTFYNNQWLELNASKQNFDIKPVAIGQEVLIVIGKHIKEDVIKPYFK